jgi:hypothetical protein
MINLDKAFEIRAKIAGFTEDEIKELQDVSEFGDSELMSEAARDIESLLDGDEIKPNQNANNAYKQKIVDFMKDHQEDMDDTQWQAVVKYVESLDSVIYANEARALQAFKTNLMNKQAEDAIANPPAEKTSVPMNSNPLMPLNNNPVQTK